MVTCNSSWTAVAHSDYAYKLLDRMAENLTMISYYVARSVVLSIIRPVHERHIVPVAQLIVSI
jgi:hypothetical protein